MDGVNQHGLKGKESAGQSLGCSLRWFQEKLVFFALVQSCHSSPWGGRGRAAVSGKRRGACRARWAGLWPQKTKSSSPLPRVARGHQNSVDTAGSSREVVRAGCRPWREDLTYVKPQCLPVWYTHNNTDGGARSEEITSLGRHQSSITVTYDGDDWDEGQAEPLNCIWACEYVRQARHQPGQAMALGLQDSILLEGNVTVTRMPLSGEAARGGGEKGGKGWGRGGGGGGGGHLCAWCRCVPLSPPPPWWRSRRPCSRWRTSTAPCPRGVTCGWQTGRWAPSQIHTRDSWTERAMCELLNGGYSGARGPLPNPDDLDLLWSHQRARH